MKKNLIYAIKRKFTIKFEEKMKGSKEKKKLNKVISHLKEDQKEYKKMSKDDSKLLQELKKKKSKM